MEEIILGTGSYDNVKSGNTLSVTGDGGNAWGYYGNAYKKLAPRLVTYTPYAEKYQVLQSLIEQNASKDEISEYRKNIEDEYIKSYYETRLKDLDVISLLTTLESKYGHDIILLCHENIELFCHRRLIADYIEIKTGIYIPEVAVTESGKIKKLIPISYKERLKEIINE